MLMIIYFQHDDIMKKSQLNKKTAFKKVMDVSCNSYNNAISIEHFILVPF